MSRTFLSAAHLGLEAGPRKYTHSSRLSHDKLHRFFVMVLPEVEKRRSGEADVAGIASTRRGAEEKAMARSGNRDAISERFTCLLEREGPTLAKFDLPSRAGELCALHGRVE